MEHIFYWGTYSSTAAEPVFSPTMMVNIQGTIHVLYRWKVIGDGGVSSAAYESS